MRFGRILHCRRAIGLVLRHGATGDAKRSSYSREKADSNLKDGFPSFSFHRLDSFFEWLVVN